MADSHIKSLCGASECGIGFYFQPNAGNTYTYRACISSIIHINHPAAPFQSLSALRCCHITALQLQQCLSLASPVPSRCHFQPFRCLPLIPRCTSARRWLQCQALPLRSQPVALVEQRNAGGKAPLEISIQLEIRVAITKPGPKLMDEALHGLTNPQIADFAIFPVCLQPWDVPWHRRSHQDRKQSRA